MAKSCCFTEIKAHKNNILDIIPVLSTEWSISLNVRRDQSIPFVGNTTCSVFQLRANDTEKKEYGRRTPFIGVVPSSGKFHISSAVKGNWNWWRNLNGLSEDQTHNIEIHQRYASNGDYRYFIKIDGEEVISVLNTDARQFYNVNVYGSNISNDPCPVFISNLKITNFL